MAEREQSKKEELKTYRSLGLGRDSKSKAGRRRVENSGVYRFIGGDSPDRPYLRVVKESYLRAWDEARTRLQSEWQHLALEPTARDQLLKPAIEKLAYEMLSQEAVALATAETNFQQTHGRRMTPHEMEIFARTLKNTQERGEFTTQTPAALRRKRAVQTVLQHVMEKQGGGQANLQQIWAQVVGPEKAMESTFESIQTGGIAYCRCMNTGMAYELRRDRTLLKKLSDALGRKLQRVVIR